MEKDIRHACGYENEVSTLFDFVLLYIKIWKLKCQASYQDGGHRVYSSTYRFICDIEQFTYDFTKALLVDAECLQYRPSVLVAALISVSIEIQLNIWFDREQEHLWVKEKCDMPVLEELTRCNKVWDDFVADFFGKKSREDIDMLGRYLNLRLQAIFQAF